MDFILDDYLIIPNYFILDDYLMMDNVNINKYKKEYKYCTTKYIKLKHSIYLPQLINGGKNDDNNTNFEKMLIFDFDSTITRFSIPNKIFDIRNLGYRFEDINRSVNYIIQKNGLENIFSELFRNKTFIRKLRKIKSDGKILIAIASYGIKEAIKILIKKYKISDLFHIIVTPIDFDLPEGFDHNIELDGKNKMIKFLIKKFKINIDNKKILLLDDNENNIIKAKNIYNVIKVENDGLKLKNLDEINLFLMS